MDLNEIGNTISDIILSEYNKKIKYDLGLEDYLKSYTKDELLKFYATHLVYNDKLDELLTFKAINGQKKAEIISKVSSNIRNIMNTFLCIMRSSCFNDLKKYFKDSNKVSFSFSNDEEIKMMTIIEIKSLFFIKCYYDRRNDRIDLYIPEYFYDIFKELVSDKNVNKINIKNNKIYKGIYALVNTYGILTFEETHELLKKLGISVKYDDFENLILTEYNDSRGYFFTGNEYGKLIYNMGYEESDVLHDYCDVLSQDVNRNLDASIIKMIGEDKYIYELKPYKSLIKYISNEYEDFKLDHKYFDMMIVLDFLSTVQLDEELAINNFYHNIDYNFEDLDKEEKEKILKYLFEIFKCYPKWNKRGNL